jgi:hypothetical protein
MKFARIGFVAIMLALVVPAATVAQAVQSGTPSTEGRIVDRASFDRYIGMFNHKNPAAFETYYAPNVRMQNGRLVLNGIPEVKEHYRKIWSLMQEDLTVENFSFDGKTLAVQLHAHFTVLKDADNSPFGKVEKGENFDYYGVIMYRVNEDGKFYDIRVAYLDFTRTTDGITKSIGMPH